MRPEHDYEYDPEGRSRPQGTDIGRYTPPAVASGQLTGNEMAWPEYEPEACREEPKGFDFMRDVIFAEFK